MHAGKFTHAVLVLFVASIVLWSQSGVGKLPQQAPAGVSPVVKTALYSITASDLKGDLSFLASDALQGRYTPSFGLDVAAEFIASRFRAAGLEPGGDQDYFQTAAMVDRHMPKALTDMTAQDGPQSFTVPAQSISIADANQATKIDHAPVIVFPSRDPDAIKNIDMAGKAIVVPAQPPPKVPREQMAAIYRKMHAFDRVIASSNAAVEIFVGQERQPQNGKLLPANEAQEHRTPSVYASSSELQKWIDQPAGTAQRSVSLDIPAPDDHKVVLKNVVGILRGSDPVLKNTCVLLSAHYDHIGTTDTAGRMAMNRSGNPSDHIYNGANDDGSGTVSVIGIAQALAKLNARPKRTVVFIAFFGEERGELGSQYYSKHPVFPLAKTVADLNLEQLGRTDSTLGPQVNDLSMTGFDYSEVTKYLEEAGKETGIKVYIDREDSDAYFMRSDNAALAEVGVPAHTLTVAFDFPDYHGLGDKWQKIDYENMARVDRTIALGLIDIANAAKAPEWNVQNSKTMPFREAQQRMRK